MPLSDSKNYEKESRGVGFSLQYGTLGKEWVSLFFYDNRLKRIGKQQAADEAAHAIRDAVQVRLMKFAKGPDRKIGQSTPVSIDMGGAFPGAVSFQSRIYFEPEGSPMTNDYVTLGVVSNCYVKMRYSSEGRRAASDERFRKIKAELARAYP